MQAQCSQRGCPKAPVGRGLCDTHYKAEVTRERRENPLPEGATLRSEREAAGMPPFALADALGISRALVCGWEKGLKPIRASRWPAIHVAIAEYRPPGPEVWFWPKVDKDGPIPEHRPDLGPCWVWTRGKDGKGYGAACRNRGHTPAHRLAWELTYGVIPDDLNVCHHCDNPPCCNPAHLFLGTQKINVADMVAKKREDFWAHRSAGRAKLAEPDVIEMRRLYEDTRATQEQLGRAFGVSQTLVSGIVCRRFWRHVP